MNILDLTFQAKRDFRPREMTVNLTTNKSFTLHNIHISFQYPTDPYTHAHTQVEKQKQPLQAV
jgi:hypothetical protein